MIFSGRLAIYPPLIGYSACVTLWELPSCSAIQSFVHQCFDAPIKYNNFPRKHTRTHASINVWMCVGHGWTEYPFENTFQKMNRNRQKEEKIFIGEMHTNKRARRPAECVASVLIGSLELFNWFCHEFNGISLQCQRRKKKKEKLSRSIERGTWWSGWAVGRSRVHEKKQQEEEEEKK